MQVSGVIFLFITISVRAVGARGCFDSGGFLSRGAAQILQLAFGVSELTCQARCVCR
jgi:hypothetical protein